MRRIAACVAICGVLAACASSPDDIVPTYVSAARYDTYTCDQIRSELEAIGTRVNQIVGRQRKKARNDQIAMGVGLVIFWPALFFLSSGSDRADEIARLRGEYEALDRVAKAKRCSVADEMARDRAQ